MVLQGGLVLFDRKHRIPAFGLDGLKKGHMGRPRVSRKDAPSNGESWQKGEREKDFMGFLPDPDLQQGFLTMMGTEREQVRGFLILCTCPTHCFPI
jgi:hypothetical protein